MADAPGRIFAFDADAARSARAVVASPGVTIESRRVPAMLALRRDARDAEFLHAVRTAFDVALPLEPNTAAGNEFVRALWLGPDEWLMVSSGEPAVRPELHVAGVSVADVSHGRAVLRINGADVRATLAKICPLDLDARHFAVDACAQTAMARINVIVDRVAPEVFDLYCARSYAGSFWHSVMEAAAEYGCSVVAPAAAHVRS